MSRPLRWLTAAILCTGVVALVALTPRVTAAEQLKASGDLTRHYAKGGAQDCLDCHDDPKVTAILQTKHATRADSRTPFAGHQCEACHGPSAEHMKRRHGKRPEPSMVFGPKSKATPAEQNAVCLKCHQGGERIHWEGSTHASRDVTCVSCHDVHSTDDPVRDKRIQDQVCFKCHKEQRAQIMRPSRHPIEEGKVTCSDCHNPHGGFGPHLLRRDSVTATCYQCHADKRGPYLFAHEPVTEDCTICHNPHGTINPAMLKVRPPFLCQECHEPSSHHGSLAGYNQFTLARACLNCHTEIHGSNNPTATAPLGRSRALFR